MRASLAITQQPDLCEVLSDALETHLKPYIRREGASALITVLSDQSRTATEKLEFVTTDAILEAAEVRSMYADPHSMTFCAQD